MALPLPSVVADVGAGGPLVTSMKGTNALINDLYGTQIQQTKAKYAPLTTQAEAASKLAYANLMGPQFLAKLMGNPDVVANSPALQDPATVNRLYQAGMGGGTGNALINMPGMGQPQEGQGNNSLLSWLWNKVKGQGQSPNSLLSGQGIPSPMPQGNQGQGFNSGYSYDQNGNNVVATPKQIDNAINSSNSTSPQVDLGGGITGTPVPEIGTGYTPEMATQQKANPTYAENAANFAGVKEEGKEAGTIRAKDIKELNDTAFNGETNQTTLDSLSSILGSPEFEQIRQLPLAGHHELAYYAKEGTPAQQNLVGQYYTLTGNVIKDSARDFAGQFRKGEQTLLQGMKPNPSDTVDTARGKAESLSYLNQMLTQRSKLTSQIMSQYHINKGQAQDLADKQLNGPAIRQQIHDKLNPTMTIRNKKTGETMTVPVSDARNKYGVQPNV